VSGCDGALARSARGRELQDGVPDRLAPLATLRVDDGERYSMRPVTMSSVESTARELDCCGHEHRLDETPTGVFVGQSPQQQNPPAKLSANVVAASDADQWAVRQKQPDPRGQSASLRQPVHFSRGLDAQINLDHRGLRR
jgi:hypothetical protein